MLLEQKSQSNIAPASTLCQCFLSRRSVKNHTFQYMLRMLPGWGSPSKITPSSTCCLCFAIPRASGQKNKTCPHMLFMLSPWARQHHFRRQHLSKRRLGMNCSVGLCSGDVAFHALAGFSARYPVLRVWCHARTGAVFVQQHQCSVNVGVSQILVNQARAKADSWRTAATAPMLFGRTRPGLSCRYWHGMSLEVDQS